MLKINIFNLKGYTNKEEIQTDTVTQVDLGERQSPILIECCKGSQPFHLCCLWPVESRHLGSGQHSQREESDLSGEKKRRGEALRFTYLPPTQGGNILLVIFLLPIHLHHVPLVSSSADLISRSKVWFMDNGGLKTVLNIV